MKLEDKLAARSQNACEICGAPEPKEIFTVMATTGNFNDKEILICSTCANQLDKKELPDANHWQCLSGSIWSEVPAVKVASWRMLQRFKNESWAADLLDMIYLDEEEQQWAEQSGDHLTEGNAIHTDCNGNILVAGDTVTLIKDLDVKGSSLNAKIGTAVRNIRLVHDNVEQIEGKVDGQMIVILTKYVKKQM